MNIQETIRDFLLGKTEITVFRAMYDADPTIENYLQSIIDEMRRTGRPIKKYPIHIAGRDMESSGALEYLVSKLSPPSGSIVAEEGELVECANNYYFV